jgi:hypothetical protein
MEAEVTKPNPISSLATSVQHQPTDRVVLFEQYAVGSVAVLVGLAIGAVSILGPLALDLIRYRWSAYSILIVAGQDLIHLFLIAPICLAGGSLRIIGSPRSKYLLVAVGPYLIYQFALLAIAPEWAHADYASQSATSQNFFWLYVVIVFGGLLFTFDSLSQLLPERTPPLNRSVLTIIFLYTVAFTAFLSVLWISQILNVLTDGVTVQAYFRAPTVFWWIRIFDLGAVVPLILLSLYAFITRRGSGGYALLLLGVGSLMSAAPVLAGSQIYAYTALPASGNLAEVLFFSAVALPVFPCYIYLIRHIFRASAMTSSVDW